MRSARSSHISRSLSALGPDGSLQGVPPAASNSVCASSLRWTSRITTPRIVRRRLTVFLDPHAARVVGVEDDTGKSLGEATPLDAIANIKRTRRKPEPVADISARNGPNLVEIAHARYHGTKALGAKKGD